jgi:hypothetical protein
VLTQAAKACHDPAAGIIVDGHFERLTPRVIEVSLHREPLLRENVSMDVFDSLHDNRLRLGATSKQRGTLCLVLNRLWMDLDLLQKVQG